MTLTGYYSREPIKIGERFVFIDKCSYTLYKVWYNGQETIVQYDKEFNLDSNIIIRVQHRTRSQYRIVINAPIEVRIERT